MPRIWLKVDTYAWDVQRTYVNAGAAVLADLESPIAPGHM
jgi:hypothetical protein